MHFTVGTNFFIKQFQKKKGYNGLSHVPSMKYSFRYKKDKITMSKSKQMYYFNRSTFQTQLRHSYFKHYFVAKCTAKDARGRFLQMQIFNAKWQLPENCTQNTWEVFCHFFNSIPLALGIFLVIWLHSANLLCCHRISHSVWLSTCMSYACIQLNTCHSITQKETGNGCLWCYWYYTDSLL